MMAIRIGNSDKSTELNLPISKSEEKKRTSSKTKMIESALNMKVTINNINVHLLLPRRARREHPRTKLITVKAKL